MSGVHHLRLWRDEDFDPQYPHYQAEIICVKPEACNGWEECREEHVHDGIDAKDGPYDNECPGFHGPYALRVDGTVETPENSTQHYPWCDEDEFEFHGVLHTWHPGWGWTVPYQGCVVAANDGAWESVDDIGIDYGTGLFIVDDDWYDETDVTLLYAGRVSTTTLFEL